MKRWLLAVVFFVGITMGIGGTVSTLSYLFGADPYMVGQSMSKWLAQTSMSTFGLFGALIALIIALIAPPIFTFWASLALATRVTRRA